MRTIITVSKCPRTHSYEMSIKRPNARPYLGERCGVKEMEAASAVTAKAMGCDEVLILAPDSVMELIPKEFGGKA